MMAYSSDPDYVPRDELCVAWHGGLAAICHDDFELMRRYGEFKDGFIDGATGVDQNNDGEITAKELEIAIPNDYVLEMLSFLDKSKDGKVTIAEVVKMVFKYEESKEKLVQMWNQIDIAAEMELPEDAIRAILETGKLDQLLMIDSKDPLVIDAIMKDIDADANGLVHAYEACVAMSPAKYWCDDSPLLHYYDPYHNIQHKFP